jgi:hypothetical protein
MTTPLYPMPSNITGLGQFFNFTASNVCVDVSNSLTCGAFIFFDIILMVIFLIFFIGFKERHNTKESYAGASTIITFISIVLYLFPYNFIRSTELIFILANEFISIIALYLIKDQ